jgi:GDPmannose 4,6-dehydratase
MWRMLQMDSADDYVIATGRSVSLEYFIERAFAEFGLAWQEHVESRQDLFRPTELAENRANPQKAASRLGWRAQTSIEEVVAMMCHNQTE